MDEFLNYYRHIKHAYRHRHKFMGIANVSKEMLLGYADGVRYFRNAERTTCGGTLTEFTRVNCDDESYWRIYKKPFYSEGTKADVYKELWNEYATEIHSDYSPTGQWFTSDYIVAHLYGNYYKIAERRTIDV